MFLQGMLSSGLSLLLPLYSKYADFRLAAHIVWVFYFTGFAFLPSEVCAQINYLNIQEYWKTDRQNTLIPLQEYKVMMPRNALIPVHAPTFALVGQLPDSLVKSAEPVAVIGTGRARKAYPLSRLMYHGVVQDQTDAGDEILISYCPLTNQVAAYNRAISRNGRQATLDFGTSGLLRLSNLVLWDQQTHSWWQQFTGEALTGELAGQRLERLPLTLMALGEFVRFFPQGQLLHGPPDEQVPYGQNPYFRYDDPSRTKPFLFDQRPDNRVKAMSRVALLKDRHLIRLDEVRRAKIVQLNDGGSIVCFYCDSVSTVLGEKEIAQAAISGAVNCFRAKVQERVLSFSARPAGGFTDQQTGSVWNAAGVCTEGYYKGLVLDAVPNTNPFAFAALAFFPGLVIYR